MPRPTTPSLYERFIGFSDEPSSEIGEFNASELINLYILNNAQQLERRKGQLVVVSGLPASTNHDMLHWERMCSQNRLIAVQGGSVRDLLDTTLVDYVIDGGSSRLTAGNDANAALLNGNLYIGNGTNQNVRFNCTSSIVDQVMPSKPETSGTTAVTGTNCQLSGDYRYRITYTSSDGIDSEPSDVIGPVTTAVHSVVISPIPLPVSAEDVSSIKVWRTTAGSTGDYYLITTLAPTVTSYEDTQHTDAAISSGSVLDQSIVRFPPCQVLVNHQERLAGIICNTSEGDTRTLYLSDFQDPEICRVIAPLDDIDNPTYGARIPLPDDGMALASVGNVLVVWTRGQALRLIGDNPNNWSLDKWVDVGCVAHRSVVVHRNLVFWLGPDGVYMAEGSAAAGVSVNRISDDIRNTFDSMQASGMAKASAFLWDQRYYLCLPDQAYYYDLKYRAWGKLTNWTWRDTTVSKNTGSAKELIYGALYGTSHAYQMEVGATDQGTAITATWASKNKDMGQFGREKRVHRVICGFTTASGDVTVTLYRDDELLDTFTHDLSEVNRTGSAVSQLDDRASEGARDEFFKLKITTSTRHATFRILRAGLHYTLCT